MPVDTPATKSEREMPKVLAWLAQMQARWPWHFIALATLTLIPAAWATLQLGFKPDFSELLPDNKDSVIEMRRVSKHLRGASTLSLIAQVNNGNHRESLRAFVDALVPKLQALGPKWVGAIDYGTQDTQKFFDSHSLFYADVGKLTKLHDQIVERYDWEVAKADGTLVDEDKEDEPPPITADSVEKELKGVNDKPSAADPPKADNGGYYEAPDGTYAAILIRTPVSGRSGVSELLSRVKNTVAAVNPEHFEPTLRIEYSGDVITSQEEYDAIIRDLSQVGALGVLGVLVSVFVFFLRVRTVLTMGGTLLVGLLWTFGLTHYTIGYLNSSTGFLVSIIAGNGINYGIMYMARYVEARRDEGLTSDQAVFVAHRDSWLPTLASAATAAIAYGSLMITNFRGFKHFGVIGGYGMALCWLTTYAFMPAILVASERVWPAYRALRNGEKPTRARGYYGVLFAKIALGAPRTTAVIGVLLGLVSVVLSVRYFEHDPMEYDMHNVRTDSSTKSNAALLTHKVDMVVGRMGQDGMAVLTDRLDQVPLLTAELDKRWKAAPANKKPFEKVVSIFSLLPSDQTAKIPLIEEMRDRIIRARAHHFVSDQDWKKINAHLPEGKVVPLTISDLPEQVARPFTERDGTRGRIVYIAPKSGESVWDAKYLMRWADSFRYVKLPTGEVIKGSGRSVIFADMISAIVEDAPKAIAVSALGTILVILIAFRGRMLAFGVFFPWLLGISSLLAFLYLRDIRLNFLNFVAIPITIGIGAEYAHNVMQRFRVEGSSRLRHVIVETGGAVTLCSMTTTIGYIALSMSINRGIRSFGISAAVGELTCLCAAVLWLPALLVWLTRRRQAAKSRAT